MGNAIHLFHVTFDITDALEKGLVNGRIESRMEASKNVKVVIILNLLLI